ncbi:hypothetical protein Tco_0116571 [Tanacetum coccineum]
MVMACADHGDIFGLQGCSSLIDQWLPCRLLPGNIHVLPDSCMIPSSARMLDRLIIRELSYEELHVRLNILRLTISPEVCSFMLCDLDFDPLSLYRLCHLAILCL